MKSKTFACTGGSSAARRSTHARRTGCRRTSGPTTSPSPQAPSTLRASPCCRRALLGARFGPTLTPLGAEHLPLTLTRQACGSAGACAQRKPGHACRGHEACLHTAYASIAPAAWGLTRGLFPLVCCAGDHHGALHKPPDHDAGHGRQLHHPCQRGVPRHDLCACSARTLQMPI
jgi:hypothetical protein